MNAESRDERTDRLLDAALARYSEAEPMLGMEARILASVREEQKHRKTWGVFLKVAALAAAVVLVVAGLVLVRGRKSQPTVATNNNPVSVAPVVTDQAAKQRVKEYPGNSQVVPTPVAARTNVGRTPKVRLRTNSAEPRQAVFPAPAPPTEQEYLLASYLNATPANELSAIAADQQQWRDQVRKNAEASEQSPAPARQLNHLQLSPLEGGTSTAGGPRAR